MLEEDKSKPLPFFLIFPILLKPCITALTYICDFVLQALLRESWLEDMTTVLQESVIPSSNLQAVDAATKRHEAITADVMARVRIKTRFTSLLV